MALLTVFKDRCKGCGLCVEACPKKLLVLSATILNAKGYQPSEIIDMDSCIACGACARTCPDMCIEIEK